MNVIEVVKHIVVKHYPRDHLALAGVLFVMLFVVFLVPSHGSLQPIQTVSDKAIQATSFPEQLTHATEIQKDSPTLSPAATIASASPLSPATASPATEPTASEHTVALRDIVTSEADLQAAQPWQNVEVQSGDNLSAIFTKVGLSDGDLFRVLNSNDEAKVLNRLYPGYQLSFNIPQPGQLQQLEVLKSPLEGYLFTRNESGYNVDMIARDAEVREAFKSGTIVDNLFMAGQQQQIPTATIIEMATIFGGVIDFILDPRAGDNFSILYEETYLDDTYVGTGEILAAQFTNQGRQYIAVRYINEAGEAGYYNPEGESMRKAFLRSPLDVFRISSNFNPSRRHPILNTIRAHKGTDYAAANGTPIRATSDGRVTFAARNGSFGKLVVLKHNGGIETKYAHLSDYGRGLRKGSRVRQGDIIGYVGATGGATGPHLHYEFLLNGVHQNPRTVLDRLPQAVSLEASEMDRFRSATADLVVRFQGEQPTLLTLNQPTAH